MKATLRSAARWPWIPGWVLGFLLLWAAVAGTARVVAHYTGVVPDLCLFHRITGHPCPTCGTTRSLLALARGEWRESFLWNPLTLTASLLTALAVLGRIITGRTLRVECSARERRLFLAAALVLAAANWAWLLHHVP